MKSHTTGLAQETLDMTIGEFVTDDYRTSRIFEKHGIDFCCGGKVSLSAVCRQRGIDPNTILNEIEVLQHTPIDRGQNYSAWRLPFLADYIVNTHHSYLKENLEPLARYARKVAGVHSANHPEVIEISNIFEKIARDMVGHLSHEEEVFFPVVKRAEEAIKSGGTPTMEDREQIKSSLVNLGREHEEVGEAIHTIRHLSRDYTLPDDACNTFMVTYQKLEEFEDDLHKHVHLENNILFPRAARL